MMKSSTWPCQFLLKQLLVVIKLHTSNKTKKKLSSVVFFYQGLSSTHPSASYHKEKLRYQQQTGYELYAQRAKVQTDNEFSFSSNLFLIIFLLFCFSSYQKQRFCNELGKAQHGAIRPAYTLLRKYQLLYICKYIAFCDCFPK